MRTAFIAQYFALDRRLIVFIADFQLIGDQAIDAGYFHPEFDFKLYGLIVVGPSADHLPEAAACLQCLSDIKGEAVLQETEYIKQSRFAGAVSADDDAEAWDALHPDITETLKIV